MDCLDNGSDSRIFYACLFCGNISRAKIGVYHKANRNRIPQFRCDFSCLHNVFHLSFLGSVKTTSFEMEGM